MKTRIFLILAVLFAFVTASHAQATKSIPLGKKGAIGLNTRIPVQANNAAISANIDRRIAAARAQAQAQAAKQAPQPSSDWLTKEDMVDEKDYVVTPAGNIKKGSWQACEYFTKWEKRQFELNMPEEQFASSREMVFLQFDISDEYCQILAQQRQIQPVRINPDAPSFASVPSIPTDLHINVNPDVTLPKVNTAQVTEPIVSQEEESLAANTARPQEARFSWTEVHRDNNPETQIVLPRGLTPRKAKRYLKHFVRDNYDDLTQALTNKKKKVRLNVGQRRLLTSYDSLCGWYKDTHPGETCPPPESFL